MSKGLLKQIPLARRWVHPDLPRRRPRLKDSRLPYQKIHDRSISESALQDSILAGAAAHGWLVHHETDSRRSYAGFPDLVLVHPKHGIGFFELKAESGSLQPDQFSWRDYLVKAGARYYVFRPRDRFVVDELLATGQWPEMEGYLV